MIPALLERAILKGWATYSKFTHAFGMYGSFVIPKGKIVIITDITWHNFLNPVTNNGQTLTRNLRQMEYQLKVDGKKSVNFLTFRNRIDFYKSATLTAGSDGFLSDDINALVSTDSLVMQPAAPITKEVYFICEEFLRLTISRNAFVESFANDVGLLSQTASQPNLPNGVQNVNVLRRIEMFTFVGQSQPYTPPNNNECGVAGVVSDRNTETYKQDLANNDESSVYPPQSGGDMDILNNTVLSTPMVEFGLVTINSNHFDQLAN